jgi:hypothetical protein
MKRHCTAIIVCHSWKLAFKLTSNVQVTEATFAARTAMLGDYP